MTLQNSLESQVNDLKLSKSQQEIAMTLVQSLDESGLLQLNSEELEELFNHRIQVDKILDVEVVAKEVPRLISDSMGTPDGKSIN